MILTLNDVMQIAYVNDWDQTDWDAQKATIPWNYTIEFSPNIDDTALSGLNTGRQITYVPRTVYVTEWIDNTMIVRPQTIFVQQLLPLENDPNTPTS